MRRFVLVLILVFSLSGCVTLVRTSPQYDERVKSVKTIAVVPADIKVYRLTAGGVRELVDEWNETAKKLIREKLKEHLAQRFNVQLKFIDEDWLKKNYKELWQSQKAMFSAVSYAAFNHAFGGASGFQTKMKNFDYTLGENLQALAKACEADSVLFIYGFDHEATAGRFLMSFWAALGGVYLLNPSLMIMGLVDGATGDVLWLKSSNGMEYSFRNEKHMESLMEWLTRDFLKQK